MPHIDCNGVRLFYEERDDGDPMVLVMGGGGSVLWWPPELLDALTGRRLILFDNRDGGLSTYTTEPYALEDLAADTIALLDALDVPRADLVGVSLGGMICQTVALRAPERVRSLALLTTTPGPDPRLSRGDDSVFDDINWDGDPVDTTVAFCRAVAGSRFPFDEAAVRALADADVARGMNMQQRDVISAAPSRLDRLGEITAPTLVVHGSEDPIFPLDHGEALASGIAGAQLLVWDGVGHELPPPLMGDLASRLMALV